MEEQQQEDYLERVKTVRDMDDNSENMLNEEGERREELGLKGIEDSKKNEKTTRQEEIKENTEMKKIEVETGFKDCRVKEKEMEKDIETSKTEIQINNYAFKKKFLQSEGMVAVEAGGVESVAGNDESEVNCIEPEAARLESEADKTVQTGEFGVEKDISRDVDELSIQEIKVETDYLDIDDDDYPFRPELDGRSTETWSPGPASHRQSSFDRRVTIPRTDLQKSRLQNRNPLVRLVKLEEGRSEPWAVLEPNPKPLSKLGTFTMSGKQVLERFVYLRKGEKTDYKTITKITKELQEFWKIILPSESLTLVRTRMEKILKLHKSFTTRVPSSSTSSEEHRPNSVWNKYRRVLAESMDFVKPENSGLSSELELGLSRATRSNNQSEMGTKNKTIDFFDTDIGELLDSDHPSAVQFAAALLQEVLQDLQSGFPNLEKIKFASLLLHLATKQLDFNLLYPFYSQVEQEVESGERGWDADSCSSVRKKILKSVQDGCLKYDSGLLKQEAEGGGVLPMDVVSSQLNLNEDNSNQSNQSHFSNQSDQSNLSNHSLQSKHSDELNQLNPTVPMQKPKRPVPRLKKKRALTSDESRDSDESDDSDYTPVKKYRRSDETNGEKKISSPVKNGLKKASSDRVRKPGRPAKEDRASYYTKLERNTASGARIGRPSKKMLEDENYKKKYKTYPCNQCDLVLKAEKHRDVHLFEEHSHGTLCPQCGYQSETFDEYDSHMKSHKLICELCQVPVLGLGGMRNHNSRYHSNEDTSAGKEYAMCYICGKELRKSYLALHVRNVHEVEVVHCDKCEFSTNTKDKLKVHMRRVHLNTTKTCPVCQKQVRMLKRHWENTKCGGKLKTGVFTCDICNKQLTTERGLKKHRKLLHLKAKDKQCEMCSYSTYSNFNLRLHITKVHTKGEMETICTICNQKTYSIDWHMKRYHDDVPWQPVYQGEKSPDSRHTAENSLMPMRLTP